MFRSSPLAVAAIAMLLAFAFLGTRGMWEPDEGRYTNVALVMLDSGDWLSPMRNAETGHWTKPPMTYWLIASSVAAFGQNAWAARLPVALAFLACVFFAWRTARLLAPGREARASLMFATMLAPFAAAQLVTTDFLLAAAEAAAMYAFLRSRFGTAPHPGWLLAMWAAFGVAFLIKGPPGLLPLLAVVAFGCLVPAVHAPRWRWHVGGVALFIAIAIPWYAAVVSKHDGLLAYFIGAEVVDRVASNRFDRNGEWYGWLKVYGPMLVLGSLPWTRSLWRWLRTWPATVRALRAPESRPAQAPQVLLLLWFGVPLLVFCFAQSRLPLYVLPLFVPMAVGMAICAGPSASTSPWPRWPWLASWIAVLLALRLIASHMPSLKDASAWAEAIRDRTTEPVRRVVFIDDTVRWGLHLHLDAHVERRTRGHHEEPPFGRKFDGSLVGALAGAGPLGTVFVVEAASWDEVRQSMAGHGYEATPLGEPYHGRRIFALRAAP